MKAILEFDLIEERAEFEEAISAPRMYCCLWEIDQWLRTEYKYGEHSEAEFDTFVKCREKLHEILKENNVSL